MIQQLPSALPFTSSIWLSLRLAVRLTYSMQKGSVNIRALFLHNLSDALASVAVIIGGSLIILYDMRWVDPAITIGIALYILYLAFTEIGGPIRTLMLGSHPTSTMQPSLRQCGASMVSRTYTTCICGRWRSTMRRWTATWC